MNVLIFKDRSDLLEKLFEKLESEFFRWIKDLGLGMLGVDASEWHAIRSVAGCQQLWFIGQEDFVSS